MKKTLIMVVAIVLVAAIAVGGTFAYLQDTDEDVNVATVGNVEIEQNEYQRADGIAYNAGEAGKGNGIKMGDLKEFDNDSAILYPAYPAGEGAYTAEKTDLFYWGDYVYSGTAGNGLWNDTKLKGALDKMIFVKNTGTSDAYFRTLIAFECPEGMEYSEGADKHFMMNVNGSALYNWEKIGYITVNNERYLVMSATYQQALKGGDQAHPSLLQVVMTHNATNEDVEKFNGSYEILALSQAVQTVNFPDAKTALDEAFGKASEKAQKWFQDVYDNAQKDVWDGTADTSWYNDTDTEFVITTAEQLAGLAELVDDGNTFEGKTIKLGKDIDLYVKGDNGEAISFDPIGDKSPFAGTFDGQGNAIENLYQSGWAFGYEWGKYGSIGLFGEIESATIKNVTIKGAEAQIEGGDIAGIAGSATGTCVFENITIEDSDFGTYNNGLGGIIGWSGAGNYTFKNIKIAEDVVLGGLWGSFDSSIGGIVGQGEPGATYNFENVDIACRIDAYNDCTASYDYYNYRMCGMIIGRLEETTTIDGTNYPDTSKYNITCNNVTVTYGDWMNYHYCEPTPGLNGGRGMRVEPGYAYGGLPADFDHSQCVDNHMNLIPFDQIFGGDQLGVKGLKTYDGVTVVYPN